MAEETLTFSELRKIEKREKRNDELSDLDPNFFLRVSNYLEMKEGDQREYRNAKRVFEKIVGLRQEKIVKNARIAVKSGLDASELEMLPRENELFREVKRVFEEYSGKVEDIINGQETEVMEEVEPEEKEAVEETEEETSEDGFKKVKIVAEVPEFMGTDLESYGPFEEGDEAEIPEENAEILLNRGNAEVPEQG